MANKKVSQLISKPSVLTTDLFPIADPSTGQLYKTTISDLGTAIGSGVSSVNGLVGAVVLDTDDIQELVSPTNKWFTDTRARAALSASSPLAYNSGTGAFSIQQSNGSQDGYLSSTDWTTFNNKLSTATAASTYVPYTSASTNVDLGSNNITAGTAIVNQVKAVGSGGLSLNSNNGTQVANIGAGGGANITLYGGLSGTSATFTGDLTISSSNPRIYLTDSDNNPDYFISNTDGTFTVYDVSNSTSRFTIGTTGNATFSNNLTASAIYLTNMTAGSGALYYNTGASRLTLANYNTNGIVVFEVNGGSTSLTLNSNLSATFASTLSATGATLTGTLSGTSASFSSNVSVGTTLNSWASTYKVIQINNYASFGGNDDDLLTAIGNNFYNDGVAKYIGTGQAALYTQYQGLHRWATSSSGTAGNTISFTQAMTLGTNSGLSIGTTSAAPTNGLLVAGAATFSSSVTAGGTISATNADIYSQNGTGSNLSIGFKQSDAVKFRLRYDISGDIVSMVGSSGNFIQTWNQSGNVGIGTTSPGEKLEVNGNIKTAAPSGGTAGSWKFGTFTSGISAIGGKVRVEINGVAYDLLTT